MHNCCETQKNILRLLIYITIIHTKNYNINKIKIVLIDFITVLTIENCTRIGYHTFDFMLSLASRPNMKHMLPLNKSV